MAQFQKNLGYYSCTVSSFEQYTLARFLETGHFEKHINRMRKFYKARRNRILEILAKCPVADRLTILEENAGLHFLVQVKDAVSDEALVQRLLDNGIRVRSLGSYYQEEVPAWAAGCLVVNYSGLSDAQVSALEEKLRIIGV